MSALPCVASTLAVAALVTPCPALAGPSSAPPQTATVGGERTVWHVVELTFQHDAVLSEGGTPNPFYDFRLDVTFTHQDDGSTYVVPGFFDADGTAGDTPAQSGDLWRVRFVPDRSGNWDWSASFRTGSGVAVADDASAGAPASFHGAAGTLLIHPADPNAAGLRSKGMLRYVGGRYLRFAWNDEAFLKGGTDSPENLLGYWEFDDTYDTGGDPNALDEIDGLHHFVTHDADFDAFGGGPTWAGGKGRALLGGLSYLASVGVNSIYFLTYNIDGGDGGEVFPWASPGSKLRYDVSKLNQWERVFDHMTEQGQVLHVVLQEEENDSVLDFGAFGDQRKLYYREMVARFGCNLGLVWNIGEETSNSDQDRKAFVSHLRSIDPYDHPIAIHTNPSALNSVYGPLLGYPDVELCALQVLPNEVHDRTLEWGDASAQAGRPWIVTNDEQNPADEGVVPDAVDPQHDSIRRDVLWGNLLAGGGGVEYYFGYAWAGDDLDCEDWRSREAMWEQSTAALLFLRQHVDYAAMRPADELTTRSEHFCLAEEGEVYLIYTPDSTPPALDLESSTSTFEVRWFDARSGGSLREGQEATVRGPGVVSLGSPPEGSQDWVALVRRSASRPPVITSHGAEVAIEAGLVSILVELHASDPDGPDDITLAGMFLADPSGASQGFYPLLSLGGDLYAQGAGSLAGVASGRWTYLAGVLDGSGQIAIVSGSFDT